ncbi:MAG: hypothetical protein ACKPEO_26170 [Sphaerospermopsis kisseleviana]
MAKKFSNLLLTPDSYAITERLSQQPLNSNQSTYVPAATLHKVENPGSIPLVILEIQNGEYLGEDDIERPEE